MVANESSDDKQQSGIFENIEQRLDAMRAVMTQRDLYACIVPMSDPHLNEYVPECWQRLQWLSGFTGSAGTLLIDQEGCWLWTDSRYFVQAAQELPPKIILMKSGVEGVETLEQWCGNRYGSRRTGVDPLTLSSALGGQLKKAIHSAGGELVSTGENLVDLIWANRPSLPISPVSIWPLEYAGESYASKLQRIKDEPVVKSAEEKHLIITTLDSIAWLLNLRGQDIPHNPVFLAYMIVSISDSGPARVRLFTDSSRFAPDVPGYLEENGVELCDYGVFYAELQAISGEVVYDPATTNYAIYSLLKSGEDQAAVVDRVLVTEGSPIPLLKSQKNSVERDGMRASHRRDGLAVCRMLHWLWQNVATGEVAGSGKSQVDEVSVDERLCELRALDPLFITPSFPSIVGVGAHGAIVHYRANPESSVPVTKDAIVLIDSGGQYRDGTTDITRTVHLGTPGARERELYTRVLKGHITLTRMVFPNRIDGCLIDAFARSFLWEVGKDYGHGTGHGVGCYLNVHEFPPSIAQKYRKAPLCEGMVVSNEPGYYEEGEFGIRIENLLLVVKADFGDQERYLKFETLTKVPYCRALIEVTLLTPDERKFVDEYHDEVLQIHMAQAETLPSAEREQFREWLSQACARL
jgi:Xaa-Pro aminopeptidase